MVMCGQSPASLESEQFLSGKLVLLHHLTQCASVNPLKMQCAHYISGLILHDHQQIICYSDTAEKHKCVMLYYLSVRLML